MRKVKWIILFIFSLIITSCASYDLKSKYQHGVDVDEVAQIARNAVEKKFDVDLSHVTWELADEYRLNRLAYQSIHNEYKLMVSHPFYARLLSSAASSNASSNILGRYKDNVKKIYINPEELENAYSYDLKNVEIAKQIYLALFIHEFVHAADFEKFSDEIRNERYLPGQSELLSALLEGNAEYLSETLCEKYNCKEGYEILDKGSKDESKKDDTEESPKKEKLSKIYKQELRLKYRLGKKYISEKYQKSQGADPMPRKLSELQNSQMLILYPENKKLINNQFKTARQMMDGFKVLQSHFSIKDYVYHYEVFSPPRLVDVIKHYTGVKLSLKNQDPPYLQAITLKLHDLSEENNDEFNKHIYFMIYMDMGGEDASRKFIQRVTDSWEKNPEIQTTTTDSQQNMKYVTDGKSVMVLQSSASVLFVVSKKAQLNNDLVLKFSKELFSNI